MVAAKVIAREIRGSSPDKPLIILLLFSSKVINKDQFSSRTAMICAWQIKRLVRHNPSPIGRDELDPVCQGQRETGEGSRAVPQSEAVFP